MKEDLSLSLTYNQKKILFDSRNIDEKVYDYLDSILNNLYINIGGMDNGTIMDLMIKEKLAGWCWQTTESAIVFFQDYDYIVRGELYLDDDNPKYFHSWIRFKFEGNEYIFDPCLNIVSTKDDYNKLFRPKIKGLASAKVVKQELIKQVNEYVPGDNTKYFEELNKIMRLNKSYIKYCDDYQKDVKVGGKKSNPNDPLFHNAAGYNVELEGNKVKKINAYYYYRCK
ncbi:MAG: hypothetical protein IKN87_04035 [Bacilli bacterium]|nr:hypothetical protein [Bacilli bacterium]